MKRSAATAASSSAPDWPATAMRVLIFAATLAAYWPALNGTLLWDDAGHVTRPELQSLAGLWRIWFEPGATQQYYPLLHSAFWFEHRLWGDATLGYHLINVLLHATSACLFASILRRLAVPGAWFAAVLFALHPVCAESVAWITEQKNTLSLLFYLLATRSYLEFDATRQRRSYVIALLWFVMALQTKTVTATLPAALLVIFWWQRGRLDARRDVAPLLPWFFLGALGGIVTAYLERTLIGAQGQAFALGGLERTLIAGRAAWFYLGKLLWPADLAFIYPHWMIAAAETWQWLFPVVVLGVLTALWWMRAKSRAPLAVALLFGGTLFPALGFVNIFPFLYSWVADHFQYHASLGVFALAASGATVLGARLSPWAFRSFAGAVGLLLATLTWHQAAIYRDVFALYTATLEKNPACWMAHNNLAIALVDAGRAAEALPHYERALVLRADYAEAENNFGFALNQLGRPADALPHLQRALQIQPRYADAQNNLGAALMGLERAPEGIAAFTRALELDPKLAVVHNNLGLAIASGGKPAEAIAHFQRALALNRSYADAELNWATALTLTQRAAEAIPHFDRALQLQPNSPAAHTTYARALANLGRYDEAEAHEREAVRWRSAAETSAPPRR